MMKGVLKSRSTNLCFFYHGETNVGNWIDTDETSLALACIFVNKIPRWEAAVSLAFTSTILVVKEL